MNEKYEKIVGLSHKRSETRKPMSLHDRAAQFAPFAALTGYEASIEEQRRQTAQRIALDEYEIECLNRKLQLLAEHPGQIRVAITYFIPDARKSGGAYVTRVGRVKELDLYQKTVILQDKTSIPIEEIIHIEEVVS